MSIGHLHPESFVISPASIPLRNPTLTWRIKTKQTRKKKNPPGRQNWDLSSDRHVQIPQLLLQYSIKGIRPGYTTEHLHLAHLYFTFTSFFSERNFRNQICFGAQLPWTNTGGTAPQGSLRKLNPSSGNAILMEIVSWLCSSSFFAQACWSD